MLTKCASTYLILILIWLNFQVCGSSMMRSFLPNSRAFPSTSSTLFLIVDENKNNLFVRMGYEQDPSFAFSISDHLIEASNISGMTENPTKLMSILRLPRSMRQKAQINVPFCIFLQSSHAWGTSSQ